MNVPCGICNKTRYRSAAAAEHHRRVVHGVVGGAAALAAAPPPPPPPQPPQPWGRVVVDVRPVRRDSVPDVGAPSVRPVVVTGAARAAPPRRAAARTAPPPRARRVLSLEVADLDPPVPGVPGSWIPAAEFRGMKSFGAFQCSRTTPACGRWISAHAQARTRGYDAPPPPAAVVSRYTYGGPPPARGPPVFVAPEFYTQQCKACKESCTPRFMWHNMEPRAERSGDSEREEKPHERALCEACRLGVCTAC